ncbi:MAG TPA: adenylate/guanylate cyclase domain-containing protein [Anaerolineales bacterium]|nr:adenylate/guanylate cyclase domain-containing protein [Anaerolineales bacterium]
MLETLNSYVPVLIRQRLAKSPEPLNAPEYETLQAAVLLADISGFTRFTEELVRTGPRGVEKVSTALNDYFGRWITIISEYGGDIVKFAGDALLAIWPADPKTGDMRDAVLQAAGCALEAHNILRGYQTAEGNPLVIRTGIAAGSVQAVHLGGMLQRWEVLVVGDAISQVSVTMQQAAPGTIVLSPSAQELLKKTTYGKPLGQAYLTLLGLYSTARKIDSNQKLFQAPQEAVTALGTYIPGAIRERLAAGQIGWMAELRNVTVLFINFPDINHEISLEIAQDVMHQLQSTLYHYEGSVNDNFVDERGATLLAAFGLPPFSHEDDALRGTLAALEIQQKMGAKGLRVSIGIASGRAFCGSIGNASRRKYTIIGHTVNLSARLTQAAGRMMEMDSLILADEATMENTRQRIRFEVLPPVTVKGRNEPVAIFKPQSEHHQGNHASVEIVGRADEREQLKQAMMEIQQAATPSPRIFIIEGEPGIGKSRLLEDTLAQAHQIGLPAFSGAADAIENSTAYYAWRTILCQMFGCDFNDPMGKRREMIASKMDEDLLERASLLNEIMQVNFPATELTANLEGRVLAENTRALLTTILQHVIQQAPMFITIEDAHWMDSASWSLLIDLSRLAFDSQLMLVITTRPLVAPVIGEAEQILQLPYARHMILERMPAQDTLTLVAHKLGVNNLPQSVSILITEKAEGHPFFSEELAYALRDAGILLIQNGTSHLAPGINNLASLNLPETVQGVITSRIDRLSPVQQLTLKVASVIGRIFEYTTLDAVYPVEAERTMLRSSLVTLEKLDITPLETPDPELAYIFKHSITRDVAYDLMLFSQRRRLHKSTAEWYEQTYASDLEPYYSLLAHHYTLAEEAFKAVFYLEKAGDHALSGGAYTETANFFEEALRISEQNRKSISVSAIQRARWEHQLGEAYIGLGALALSSKHFEKSAEMLGWPSPVRKSALLGSILRQVGIQAWRLIWDRLPQPSKNPSQTLDAARAHERLVDLYYFAQDRPHLLNSALHALNLTQKAPPSPDLARAYALACTVSTLLRSHGLATKYQERALEIVAQVNHLPSHARVFGRTGLYNIGTGNYKRAIELLDQASEISNRLRDYRQWGESTALRAWTSYLVADFEDSRARFEKLFNMAKQVGNIQYQNWGQWGQSHALLRLNRLQEARLALNEVLQRLKIQEDSGAQVVSFGLMAIISMHLQDWETMLEYGKRLVPTEKGPARFSIADFEGYASVAEVFLTLWQRDATMGILNQINYSMEECQTAAGRAVKSLEKYAHIYALAQPRAHYLKGWLVALEGKSQEALQIWKNGLQLAQTLGMPYEEARLHDILSRHLPAEEPQTHTHRDKARQMFEDLNAQLDLNKE